MTRTQEMVTDIASLKETTESSSQRMNAVEQRLTGLDQKMGTLETTMTGMMASMATMAASIQNLEKALGKKPEEPTASDVTTSHQTPLIIELEQNPSRNGLLGENPEGSSNRVPDPPVRAANPVINASSSQPPARNVAEPPASWYEPAPTAHYQPPAQNQGRISRIEYPTFDGGTSVRSWIF